jgi:hypothetical protein
MFALNSSKRLLIAAVALALSASPFVLNAQDSDDPPPEAGRISYITGTVSIQPVSSEEWGQAYPNLPVGPGDRIFTDNGGRAEVQIGRTYVRIGPNSDVTLVEDSQFNINFGVAQGSIRLHSFGLWPRQLVDISTPNGNAEFGEQGDLRVDVLPQDGATVFTNLGQFADITGAGDYRQQLDYGQSLEVAGTNPVYPQWLQPAGPDDLDSWSQERDQAMTRVASYNYVSPDVPGAADLDSSGDWQPETEYGPMWFPRSVSADWEPYRNGHWINRQPWGWVWVEEEPWGYAPFHYGRWVMYRDRWGWLPGPVNVRPVWSPALVVFAGGGGGGLSLSAWFPLGPGEAYRPWYRCSPRYIDQVNITNIRESRRVHVERTYVNVVNVTNVTNINYVNRTHVTAVRRDDFGSGRRVRDVAVRMDPRQMQQIRPLAQPQVAAPSRPIITRPVAHVPARVERPMLINQRGQEISARPGVAPVAPPVRHAAPPRPLPGRTVVAAPAHQAPNGRGPQNPNQFPSAQGNRDQRQDNRPNQSNQPPFGAPRANPAGPVPGYQRGVEQRPGTSVNGNQQPANPNNRQQPPQLNGRPLPPNYQQQENRQIQPQVNQPQNQPDRGRPNDGRPNDQRQGRPDNPQHDRPNQPVPPNYQQPQRPTPPPSNQQQERPIPPTYQQPNPQQGRPSYPQPDRRNQPNEQPRPNQPQNPQPSDRNRPDVAPGQQRRDTPPPQERQQDRPQERPTPPAQQNRPYLPPPQQRPPQREERQAPPPQQERQPTPPPPQQRPPQREERQAPPPRSFEQPRQNQQPPPQARPQQNERQNNRDEKRDNRKEDKKPHD